MPNPREHYDWLTGYLDWTDNTEPDQLYRIWTAVYTMSSALQRRVWIEWGPYNIYPNFYIVLVGPSGRARKSTAMSGARILLGDLGISLAAAKTTNEKLISELSEATETETMPNGVAYTHSSLSIYASELVVFLGYNNPEFLAILADWWDSPDFWDYKTKGSGEYEVENLWISVLGAITPELVRSSLPVDTVGGGLSSRMIFVYADDVEKHVALPIYGIKERSLQKTLVTDLSFMQSYYGPMEIDESFKKLWVPWYEETMRNPPIKDPHFQGYLSRRPVHLLKLTMIMAISKKSDTNQKLITAEHLKRAIELLEATEARMEQTFAGYGTASDSEVSSMVLTYIARKVTTTQAEVYTTFMYYLEGGMPKLIQMLRAFRDVNFITLTKTGTDIKIEVNKQHEHYQKFAGAGGSAAP